MQHTTIQPPQFKDVDTTNQKSYKNIDEDPILHEQYTELIYNIKYASKKIQCRKWNLAEYYEYMADFHDYIDDPAPILRHKAEVWKRENSVV